jgi:hypothetical protein
LVNKAAQNLRKNVPRNASTRRQAARYLLLRNSPPADSFDPDLDVDNLDHEFLLGDQLDELPAPEPLIERNYDRSSSESGSSPAASRKMFSACSGSWAGRT